MPAVRVGKDGGQFSLLFQVEEEGGSCTVFFHCLCINCEFVKLR